MHQHDNTEYAKKGRSKYPPMLYTTANAEGVRGGSIKLHDSLHVNVVRLDDIQELGWESNLGEDPEHTLKTHKVESLREISEGGFQRLHLLYALLL